jgi:hypothetical protein
MSKRRVHAVLEKALMLYGKKLHDLTKRLLIKPLYGMQLYSQQSLCFLRHLRRSHFIGSPYGA